MDIGGLRRTGTVIGTALALAIAGSATPVFAATPARTITAVGSLKSHTNQPSKAQESITVSPAAAGDVLVLAIETKYPGTPAFAATGVSGGGVTTWNPAMAYATIDGFHGQELWWGAVTSPGSGKTITASFSAGATKGKSESATSLDVQELRSSGGAATVWSVDGTGKVDKGAKSSTPSYPTLTPSAGADAYFGYLAVPGSVGPGSTPGVVYKTDARSNQVVYAVAVSGAITPKASSSSQTFSSSGMLLTAK